MCDEHDAVHGDEDDVEASGARVLGLVETHVNDAQVANVDHDVVDVVAQIHVIEVESKAR